MICIYIYIYIYIFIYIYLYIYIYIQIIPCFIVSYVPIISISPDQCCVWMWILAYWCLDGGMGEWDDGYSCYRSLTHSLLSSSKLLVMGKNWFPNPQLVVVACRGGLTMDTIHFLRGFINSMLYSNGGKAKINQPYFAGM